MFWVKVVTWRTYGARIPRGRGYEEGNSYPLSPACVITVQPWNKGRKQNAEGRSQSTGSGRRRSGGGERRAASQPRRTGRRSIAVLSGMLAAAGIASLQVDLPGVRLLHVLRGLLLRKSRRQKAETRRQKAESRRQRAETAGERRAKARPLQSWRGRLRWLGGV
jgi:hypothetical protein